MPPKVRNAHVETEPVESTALRVKKSLSTKATVPKATVTIPTFKPTVSIGEDPIEEPVDVDNRDNPVDEEAEDRDEAYVAKMAQEFAEDEESVRHDVFPETDDEDNQRNKNVNRTQFRRGDGCLFKGQSFYNGVSFKEAVTDYCLRTGYNIRQYRYDKDKLGFKCVGSEHCKWQCYASSLPKDPMWRIRIYKEKHDCIPNGHCDLFKVPVIARLFVDKIRDDPEFYVASKLENIVMEQWKIRVSRAQCQAARDKALRWLEVQYDAQFNRLKDYAEELKQSNPGTIVEVDTIRSEEGEGVESKDLFNRFYVCFDALRKTWKETCRPLLGVDGCFLKAKIKGELLVALGRDADNAIYPVAWSVVQVENKENWLWFTRRLKLDLELGDGDGYVLVSDRQKGLIAAVEQELPRIEHRMCVRHIYGNLKKNHPSKMQMKPLLWNLAWSYNETEFQRRLLRIKDYDTAVYAEVMKSNPRRWCRAFYRLGSYCEDVENNSVESFNRTINKAREKPFVAMLESVRRLAMVRIAKRSVISHKHQGQCTPYVIKFLKLQHEQASACKVSPSTNQMYEVVLGGETHKVSLRLRTCTCMKFQICGIPCQHAYGVIMYKKLVPEDYVCEWFRTSKWRLNYTEGITPVRGHAFWPETNWDNVYPPPQPAQPGRKKIKKSDKKRIRGVNESPTKIQPKQKKRTMHCGICRSDDHNCRTHEKAMAKAQSSQEQSSQVVGSQVGSDL